MSNHTTLHINCDADKKASWMLSARICNMSFEDWVREMLDGSTVDASPNWSIGLSERSRVCLLSAGFNSRESVSDAEKNNFQFYKINNAGYRVQSEIKNWLK